ncbi:hypothetical protein VKT23_008296 [Stygiomarasmius scandens]|uniref:Uncharacterized protein n=1 Tax=Marasmiellus scandens TaxID=2682957 RepID=A0ABR1JHU1_9AGAR
MPTARDFFSRLGILNGAQGVHIAGGKITTVGRDQIVINISHSESGNNTNHLPDQRLPTSATQPPLSAIQTSRLPSSEASQRLVTTQDLEHRGGRRKRVVLRLSGMVKACFPCGATPPLSPRQERPPGDDDVLSEEQAEHDIPLSTMGPDPNRMTSDPPDFLDHSRPAMPTPILFPHPEVSSPEVSAFTAFPWTSEPEEMTAPPISRAHTLPFPMTPPPGGPTATFSLDLDMPTSGSAPMPGRSATISFGTARPFFPIR